MGREYLDCVNNVAHVGHSHPKLVQATCEELGRLQTNSRYLHPMRYKYMKNLLKRFPLESGLNTCFLVCSGSEANDLAVRIALEASSQKNGPNHNHVVCLDGAYHGHTQLCVDISPYKYKQHKSYKPGQQRLPWVHEVSCPDVFRGKFRDVSTAGELYAQEVAEAIKQAKSTGAGVAAFIAESVVSCGGQVVLPPRYLQGVYQAIHANGGVCIADEVQCGFGRVGEKFWGFETHGVYPDIVTIAKPMGNGYPMGAVILKRELADRFAASGMEYFSTTGGNNVACVVANTVLEIIDEEKLQEKAEAVGQRMMQELRNLQPRFACMGDVRGQGLFVGIDLVKDSERSPDGDLAKLVCDRMRYCGVLLTRDGPYYNVLKIKPPMTFGHHDTDTLVAALTFTLAQLEQEDKVAYTYTH